MKKICLVTLTLIALVFILVGCSQKVEPFDFVKVEFTGFSTCGKTEVAFTKDALIKSIIGEEPGLSKEYFEWFESYETYWNEIELTCSKEDGLSNGDAVTVTISVKGDAARKIKSDARTYTVQGLQEIQTIDVFQDVEVKFNGISGDGELEFNLLSDNEVLKACDFSFSQEVFLSSGDVVTVSIDNEEEITQEYGYILAETTKDYTVAGLREYLTDPTVLSKEELRSFVQQFLVEQSNQEEDWGITYSDPIYYNAYFCTAKHEGFLIKENVLKLVITYNQYLNGELREVRYTWLDFEDIIVEPDGTIDLAYDMGECFYFTTDIEEYLTELQEDYNVVELRIAWNEGSTQDSAA